MNLNYFDLVRPPGCIHITTLGVTPVCGVWEKIAQGMLLVNTASEPGIISGHRANNVPAHTHTLNEHTHGAVYAGQNGVVAPISPYAASRTHATGTATGDTFRTTANAANLDAAGETDEDHNLAPYKVVEIYKRTDTNAYENAGSAMTLFNSCFPVGTLWYGYNEDVFDLSDIEKNGAIQFNTFGSKRVFVGMDAVDAAFDTLGKEGGHAEQTLSSHFHGQSHIHRIMWALGGSGASHGQRTFAGYPFYLAYASGTTSFVGENSASDDNYQPYIALYARERVA